MQLIRPGLGLDLDLGMARDSSVLFVRSFWFCRLLAALLRACCRVYGLLREARSHISHQALLSKATEVDRSVEHLLPLCAFPGGACTDSTVIRHFVS